MRNLVLALVISWCAATQPHAQEPADESAWSEPAAEVSAPALASHRSIVDTAFVVEAIKRDAIMWDVRTGADYAKGRIYNAVNLGDPLKTLRTENTEDFIDQAVIEELLGGAGIDPDKEIVVYGAKASPSAYFALFTLQYFGAKHAYVYHGGIDDWRAEGRQLSTQPSLLPSIGLKLTPDTEVAISTSEVIAKLNRPEVQFVDVRTGREFGGEDIRALRGGHIPGAINIAYERNWAGTLIRIPGSQQPANKDALAIKPVEELKALYANLDPDKETIVYCQSGSRASITTAILKDLGFRNVKLYDSSWIEYGNTFEAPVEDLTFFNVTQISNRLSGMQKRIEELEKELGAMKDNNPSPKSASE